MKSELTEVLPQLRRFAYSLTGSMDDADDLLQSTVERALNRTVPEGVELTKWLFRVCRNLWIDGYRSRKVRQEATFDPQLQEREIVDGERAMSSEVELDQVSRAMDQLPVAVQGLSYKEAAATLEIPPGTVMSRLARARTALIQSLNLPVARTSP